MIHFENPTIEEILEEKEGQLFEQKSARIDPCDLVNHFMREIYERKMIIVKDATMNARLE